MHAKKLKRLTFRPKELFFGANEEAAVRTLGSLKSLESLQYLTVPTTAFWDEDVVEHDSIDSHQISTRVIEGD